jgi:Spy/CpxP family protein refolding chaperone
MKVPKKFTSRATALAALIILCAAPAFAQRGKWWQDDGFVRELGLTGDQRTRLEEIFQKTQPVLRQRMHALDDAEVEFDRRVEKGDDNSVMDQAAVVEAARAELNKARTMMLLRMRRSLTTDQWAKFTALHLAAERVRVRSRASRGQSGRGR